MGNIDDLTKYQIEKTHQTLVESDRRLTSSYTQLALLVALGFLLLLAGDQTEVLELALIGLTFDRATGSSIVMVLAAAASFRTMTMITFNDRVEKHYALLLTRSSLGHEVWPTRFPSLLLWGHTVGQRGRPLDRALAGVGAIFTLALPASPIALIVIVLLQEPMMVAIVGAIIAVVLMLATIAAFWHWISS